jgi:hypothetical protein
MSSSGDGTTYIRRRAVPKRRLGTVFGSGERLTENPNKRVPVPDIARVIERRPRPSYEERMSVFSPTGRPEPSRELFPIHGEED